MSEDTYEYELTESWADEDDTAPSQPPMALATVDATPAPAVTPARTFSRDQLDLIKTTVANGTSDDEFRLFIEVCKLTGLNPFAKQIYAIMRSAGKDAQGRWIKRMTIQTGIDGYRLMAARTGELAGIDDPTYDTEDGEHPNRATVTVYRLVQGQRMPFVATARWREYAALDKDANPTNLWAKMPWLMLGKCSEALALRKAFAAELSGVYTSEEMAQADNPDTTPTLAPPTPQPSQPQNVTKRAEKPVSRPAPSQAPATAKATPAPLQPRTEAVVDERVSKALRNQSVLGLLTTLGYAGQQERRDKLTATLQALDAKANGQTVTGRDLMDTLEAEITAQAAAGHNLRETFNGPRAS